VELIADGLRIQPDRVFIISAQRDMSCCRGLSARTDLEAPRMARRHYGVLAIPSRTLGWQAYCRDRLWPRWRRRRGASRYQGSRGTTIAQRLDTARQSDMPESAIATGFVDFIPSTADIAKTIVQIAHSER